MDEYVTYDALTRCRENLLIAIIAQAVEDAATYVVQEWYFPADEFGQPPEAMFQEIDSTSCYIRAARTKFPKKTARGVITNAEDYAKYLMKQKKYYYLQRYHAVINDGKELVEQCQGCDKFMTLVAQKSKYLIEDIEKGIAVKLPPFKKPFQRKEEL